MRTFILALAAIVPAFAIERVEAADEIPAFDIARNCNAETAGAAIGGPASCRSSAISKHVFAQRSRKLPFKTD